MKRKIVLGLSVLLLLTAVFWQKGRSLATEAIFRQRRILPPVAPAASVSGRDPHADAVAFIDAAEVLLREEAVRQIQQSKDEAEDLSSLPVPKGSVLELARLKELSGDKKGAKQLLDQAAALLVPPETGKPDYDMSSFYTRLAEAYAQIGDRTAAQHCLTLWVKDCQPLQERVVLHQQVRLNLLLGDPAGATKYLRRADPGIRQTVPSRLPGVENPYQLQADDSSRQAFAAEILEKYPNFKPAEQVIQDDLNPRNPEDGRPLSDAMRTTRIKAARLTLIKTALQQRDYWAAAAGIGDITDFSALSYVVEWALKNPASQKRNGFIESIVDGLEDKLKDLDTPMWRHGSAEPRSLMVVSAAQLALGTEAEAEKVFQTALDRSQPGSREDAVAAAQLQTMLQFFRIVWTLPEEDRKKIDITPHVEDAWRLAERSKQGSISYAEIAQAVSRLLEPAKAREVADRAEWEIFLWERDNLDKNGKAMQTNAQAVNYGSAWPFIAVARAWSGDTRGAATTLGRMSSPTMRAYAMLLVASAILTKANEESSPATAPSR